MSNVYFYYTEQNNNITSSHELGFFHVINNKHRARGRAGKVEGRQYLGSDHSSDLNNRLKAFRG